MTQHIIVRLGHTFGLPLPTATCANYRSQIETTSLRIMLLQETPYHPLHLLTHYATPDVATSHLPKQKNIKINTNTNTNTNTKTNT
jgi:hypothetical protein